MESFAVAVNAVMPFLIYISFGYGVRMSGLVDEDFMNKLNKLIFRAFFPILMFNNLYKMEPGSTLDGKLAAVGIASILLLEVLLVLIVPKLVKNVVTNPLIMGAVTGLVFFLLGIHLPSCVNETVSQFAGLTTPLALFVLGGTLHFSAVKGNLKYLVPSLTVKMIVLPAIITVAATAMGFGSLERFVLFTMYATPVATASYSMAQNMGGDGELAGQFVVVSTAASIVTIFLWVLLFKSMGMI